MGITKTQLFNTDQNELAVMAKAFAHPARIAIIQYLLTAPQCINGDLVQELGLAQATISQHLKILKEMGLVKGTVEGTAVCYCINEAAWTKMRSKFEGLFDLYRPTDECC